MLSGIYLQVNYNTIAEKEVKHLGALVVL